MGSIKRNLHEGIYEGDTKGKEAADIATDIEEKGSEIKSLLDSIDTSMDEDDVAQKDAATDGYSKDIKGAVADQVDPVAQEGEDILRGSIDTANAEGDKVRDAEDKYSRMEGVSDIGRSNAAAGADAMRRSLEEYEEAADQAESAIEENRAKIDETKSRIDSTWG